VDKDNPKRTNPIIMETLTIKVKTNQAETEIIKQEGNELTIALKAKPINNEANIELVKFLKKQFKKNVRFISGRTSKIKVVELL